MSDRFTSEQRAALDAQGRVIVSASAGSGKTTVMIEKIIQLIQSGVGVDEILAVTFTKKAAAQMKEKLSKALIEAINGEGISSERQSTLKKQLSEVPSADISTIHSFCAKLLRTYFYAAGVDSAFRVIGGDDAEGIALKNEALDEVLEEGYASKEAGFAHLLSVYWRKKSDNTLRKILAETYEKLRNRADYRDYLAYSKDYGEEKFDAVCKDLYSLFTEKCRYYQEMIEDEQVYFSEGKSPQRTLADELYGWTQTLLSAPDYFALAKTEKPKFTANRKGKDISRERLRHIEKLSFVKERLVKAYESEFEKLGERNEELALFIRSGQTAEALAVYLLKFDEKYEELKRERGVLDYNDLEHKTLTLLKDEQIAAAIKTKYRYVFVDEYQDVNPVQEAIISLVSAENLFLVGDIKQSIYGFRGSKSRFFAEKQRAFAAGEGISLSMTRNFRSADKVLDAVNAQFSLAMTPRVCDVDYARDSYMERGGRYPLGSGKVRVHFFGTEEKKTSEERGVYSVRERAADKGKDTSLLAKRIRQIIEEEKGGKIYDADLGEVRPLEYADIAILSRKKQGQIGKTVALLSAENIPVSTATAVNICDYAEIKTLMDILSLIDNAEQDVPLCSALLSAMGKLSTDDLTEIRLAYKGENFFRTACRRYAEEKKDRIAAKLQKFYEYFYLIRTRARVYPAGEILTWILSETRMEAEILKRENGVACMRRVHRFIEETVVDEPLYVHDFLDRLRALDYRIEYCEGGGENSVKVLTMHSSKGLEYPVVILDNLSLEFRGGDYEEVYAEEKYGLAPRAFDEENMTKSSTCLRRLHEWKERRNSVLDELNLYYVALTRAKHTLHMLFEKPTVAADVKYARSFAEFTDFSVWEEYIEREELFDVPKLEREALEYHPDPALVQSIIGAYQWKYPYSGCENLPVKSSATALIAGSQNVGDLSSDGIADVGFGAEEVSDEAEFVAGESRTARERAKAEGIAYHAFLENFAFNCLWKEDGTPIEKGDLEAVIASAVAEQGERGVEGNDLLEGKQIFDILSNPVFYQLRGMRLYKECKFLAALPIKDTYGKAKNGDRQEMDLSAVAEEEMIFQGAIDLLAVDESTGDVQIIDYKYSVKDAEYLQEHYRLQLELYRMAAGRTLKKDLKKIRCTLVNIRLGYQVDLD
ncbi:MAG: UvrD-helicase domain-containing protein [Clostridia bacterium]|nr:UvrD-helicase domain-containing protein [Clostridia bacterium]